jgi:hypothetical protein
MSAPTVSRGAITLPSKATEPQAETRRLRPAAATPAAQPTPTRTTPAVAATNGHAAPAAAAAPAPAAGASAAGGPPSTEQFSEDLLRVVSERTGYPVDMLDKDVPLEAGLGIDSIKTVEVFSKLKPYHAYFQRPDQDEEEVLKVFTRLKTLRDIENLYDEQRRQYLGGPAKPAAEPAPSNGVAASGAASNGSSVKRFELEAVEAVASGDEKKNRLSTTS